MDKFHSAFSESCLVAVAGFFIARNIVNKLVIQGLWCSIDSSVGQGGYLLQRKLSAVGNNSYKLVVAIVGNGLHDLSLFLGNGATDSQHILVATRGKGVYLNAVIF